MTKPMDDLISRQAAIDAVYDAFCYAYCDNCEKEMNEDLCGDCHRKYQNWSASKKIIEKVINNLPSAQPELHYCRECKWSRCYVNKNGNSEIYWRCLNWDGGTDEEGYCHEWEEEN